MFVPKDAQCCETCEKRILPFFFFWEMVDFVPKIIRELTKNGQFFFVPKDEQCSEIYEKTIFRFVRFLIFEQGSILYSKFLENWDFEIFTNLIQKR